MNDPIKTINQSLIAGYIDKSVLSYEQYLPDLLTNQTKPPKKVLTSLLRELENCTEFFISVAFVTASGVATIINKLKELEEKKVTGKILVSQYLNFTQPEALKRLAKFNNIELRIATTGNFHSKGYIFKLKGHYNLIVGSSNLTAQALTTNKEWNLKITALNDGSIISKVLNEFEIDFASGQAVTDEFIRSYEQIYKQQSLALQRTPNQGLNKELNRVIPNKMQEEALSNLQELRQYGKNKALIISATGTGKTYLSAFDARAFSPKTLLFVVHRLSIAKSSLETFQKVFGTSRSMGLFSGSEKELDKDFVFSTIQTISKEKNLELFKRTHFEFIIIDETHRSGAKSYAKLLDYFRPQFLLGMTATPERSDGNDIYKIFEHNIAYEIRLHQAMAENMLCDFHYYGVTDLIIDGEKSGEKSRFNFLVSDERVRRITETASFYGTDDGETRGLIFCSRKREAHELSNKFNSKGFKTVALTGESTEEERYLAIKRLETENHSEKLDYIFTVDIFNEGIDIPKVNQVILLRPTESAIIFIQQLGRGLRKAAGKSYLTVVDFIGSYENNYLIPIALYGDTSYSKDSLRKLITAGSNMIPGASTVNFDKIAKEKIFKSIDTANMQLLADLKRDYFSLKNKLGRIPYMMDFIKYGHRDPFLFVTYANLNSFYKFIVKVEASDPFKISKKQSKALELFYKEINNGKRVEESLILNLLLKQEYLSIVAFKEFVRTNYGYHISNQTINSCVNHINFRFTREKEKGKLIPAGEKYNLDVILLSGDKIHFTTAFIEDLKNQDFKSFLADSINYSIHTFNNSFDLNNWNEGFVLYKKYSRKDVFRILNVDENPVAQNVGGYLVSPDNAHCPIFVNYHKEDHISESTKYEDQFVNNKEFDWMSKSNNLSSA
jgi:superfamily II DNA or RNA helicase